MNYNEIIELCKTEFEDVSAFASLDFKLLDEEEYSEELQILLSNKKQLIYIYQNHPGHKKYQLRDDKYKESYDNYIKYMQSNNIFNKLKEETLNKLALGKIEKVEHYGGEGEGETYYDVLHFVDHDIYIRIDGFYTSYDGVSYYDKWNCCKEVRPKEKTITVYE